VSSSRITYIPRPDANTQAELDALSNVYKFVLDCRAKKEGSPATAPEDAAKEIKDVCDATRIIPE